MTDQDYIYLKQQQKKRSNKLKERNRNWYMEENNLYIKNKKNKEN